MQGHACVRSQGTGPMLQPVRPCGMLGQYQCVDPQSYASAACVRPLWMERRMCMHACTQSARDGDPNSMLRLAKMYLYGQGCERNVNIAVEWLRKARQEAQGGGRGLQAGAGRPAAMANSTANAGIPAAFLSMPRQAGHAGMQGASVHTYTRIAWPGTSSS